MNNYYKLGVLQRQNDKSGWHESTQFQTSDINNIQIINSSNNKSLNAIPSPLARIHLFDAAFNLVDQDEVAGTNISGDAYKKLVSDCFDVFELIFNWNTHIRDRKKLEIISWNKDSEIESLTKEFIEEKAKKIEEFRSDIVKTESLNISQIKGYKENLIGETLSLYLNNQPFSNCNEIHIILYDDKPIAGTSPFTGFFVTPNDLANLDLVNPINGHKYFSKYTPFSQRNIRIQKFIYDFIIKSGSDIFDSQLAICRYLDRKGLNLDGVSLKLEKIESIESRIFNNAILLRSNSEAGVTDYFENYLLRVKYKTNDDCFYVPMINSMDNAKRDYLLPFTPRFFAEFDIADISSKVTIIEKGSENVEVTIKGINGNLSKKYAKTVLNKDVDGQIIDWCEDESPTFDLGIFPFLKITHLPTDVNYNDFYRVMFGFMDGSYKNNISNSSFKLRFGKDRAIVDADSATNYIVTKEDRTVFEKNHSPVGSTYYSLNFSFDYIQVEITRSDNSIIRCMVAPKWRTMDLGTKRIDFAIDFGTTTTFVAYTADANHSTLPKKFELDEEGADHSPIALLNKPNPKNPAYKNIDRFESYTVLPDFSQFFELQKQEFLPSLINKDKYSFPLRTVLYEKDSVPANKKKSLSNSNIAFAYQKDYHEGSEGKQDYITNLKWNVNTDENFKASIEVFIEELFYILRIKCLLNNGDPRRSYISWFSPLSFTPGAQFAYNTIWGGKFLQVFKSPNHVSQIKNITESEAPFYYYSKTMAGPGGANGIQDTSAVLTLDIGGGTTDLMFFRNAKPMIGSSFQFGANVIWGDGYSEFRNEKQNGIYVWLKDTISDNLRSKLSISTSINDHLNKEGSNFGSDEIINFWINNNEESKVLNELRSGKFKLSYLLHLSALIYHSLKLLKYHNQPTPMCIIFTGNGSKYLDLIQSKDYIEKIFGYFNNILYPLETRKPQVILPTQDRKEATCYGGLYQPFNEPRIFEAVNYLGFETVSDKYLKYSDIEQKKDIVFENLNKSFLEFIEYFFKMNEAKDLSFRTHFGIESNLVKFKNFIIAKTKENLITGYDKRKKLVGLDDVVTDSLFFYPLIGIVYQINKLNNEGIPEDVIPTIYYALSPDYSDGFDISRLTTDEKSSSIFLIHIERSAPNSGEITLIPHAAATKRAMSGINGFLKTVCDFDEYPTQVNKNIDVLAQGKVEKDTSGNKWRIQQKIKIKFVP